jgi:hypothetical protein
MVAMTLQGQAVARGAEKLAVHLWRRQRDDQTRGTAGGRMVEGLQRAQQIAIRSTSSGITRSLGAIDNIANWLGDGGRRKALLFSEGRLRHLPRSTCPRLVDHRRAEAGRPRSAPTSTYGIDPGDEPVR